MTKYANRNKLIVIHKDLSNIYTGGQYRLAEFISFVKKKNINYEIIDCGSLRNHIQKNRLSFLIFFLQYFLQHRKRIFIIVDHTMHLRLIIPFFISRLFGNHYALVCLQTFYNFRKNIIMKRVGFFCEFLFLRGASHLIFSSRTAVHYFKAFHLSHKSRTIVNPAPKVLSNNRASIRNKVRKLLFVGQIQWWKGLDILLKALAKLTDMNLHLDVAGRYDNNSEYYRMLSGIINKNGLLKNVHFHGNLFTQDLAVLYQQADIFVLPSRYETYGIVLLEAMSFGLPIISSAIPSAITIIKKNTNGILYETENPEALAEALRFLSSNKKLRKRMHNNNLKMRTHFRTWGKVSDEMFQAINKFL